MVTPSTKKGFTLLELIVSLAIFTLLTTTLLVKNAQYKGTTVITNLAYEMALTIRQAQVYGINVRQFDSSIFTGAYGVHFTRAGNETTEYNPRTIFRIFADKNGDGHYTDLREDVEKITLRNGNIVYQYCVLMDTDRYCPESNVNGSFDIMFKRPSPEAKFYLPGQLFSSDTITGAQIYLLAPQGICRRIDVSKTGQISVSSDIYRSGEGNTNPCTTKIEAR